MSRSSLKKNSLWIPSASVLKWRAILGKSAGRVKENAGP
jgi:hypothetical protein